MRCSDRQVRPIGGARFLQEPPSRIHAADAASCRCESHRCCARRSSGARKIGTLSQSQRWLIVIACANRFNGTTLCLGPIACPLEAIQCWYGFPLSIISIPPPSLPVHVAHDLSPFFACLVHFLSRKTALAMENQPAAPAPSGYVVHMHNPETSELELGVAIGAIAIAISTLLLLLRLYTRVVFTKSSGIDDVFISLTWACATVFQAMVIC